MTTPGTDNAITDRSSADITTMHRDSSRPINREGETPVPCATTEARSPDCSSRDDDPDGDYVFINNSSGTNLKEAFRRIGKQVVHTRRIP